MRTLVIISLLASLAACDGSTSNLQNTPGVDTYDTAKEVQADHKKQQTEEIYQRFRASGLSQDQAADMTNVAVDMCDNGEVTDCPQ